MIWNRIVVASSIFAGAALLIFNFVLRIFIVVCAIFATGVMLRIIWDWLASIFGKTTGRANLRRVA